MERLCCSAPGWQDASSTFQYPTTLCFLHTRCPLVCCSQNEHIDRVNCIRSRQELNTWGFVRDPGVQPLHAESEPPQELAQRSFFNQTQRHPHPSGRAQNALGASRGTFILSGRRAVGSVSLGDGTGALELQVISGVWEPRPSSRCVGSRTGGAGKLDQSTP